MAVCIRITRFFLLILAACVIGCKDNGRLTHLTGCEALLMGGPKACSTKGNPLVGECHAGTLQCTTPGQTEPTCVGEQLPGPKLCNGKDNDCDGKPDTDATPETDPRIGQSCGQEQIPPEKVGIGQCRLGTYVCTKDKQLDCVGLVPPSAETCDGVDNDCDGRIDDGLAAFTPCVSPGNPLIGECRPGVFLCVAGQVDDSHCVGEQLPMPETHNGKDSDCDGVIDGVPMPTVMCAAEVITEIGVPVAVTVTASVSGGSIVAYRWLTIAGPAGGINTPMQWNPDPPNARTEQFDAVISGTYTVRVFVTTDLGTTGSCDTVVHVIGVGLRVELSWDGLGDMDLHVHNGDTGPWFNPSNDCYYGYTHPDWPPPGVDDADARLDFDNTAGYGPENTRIRGPTVGERYVIGIHNFGRSAGRLATVRVFCGSADQPQATIMSPHTFAGDDVGNCTLNDFWKAAYVTFLSPDTCVIDPIDAWSSSASRCLAF